MKTCKIKYTIFAIAFVVACLLPFNSSDNFCCQEGISFEQNILSIIAILTAIIVSIHVVDYFRIKELDEKQKKLQDDLLKVREIHTQFENNLWLTRGFALVELEPFLAFWCFCQAFEKAISGNDAEICMKSLNKMSEVIKAMTNKKKMNERINQNGYNKIKEFKETVIPQLKLSKLYSVFKERFEDIINDVDNFKIKD